MKKLAWAIATAGGAGFSPVAPGTAGSLVGLLAWLWIGQLAWPLQLTVIALVLFLGWWASDVVEKATGSHDNQRIVIDEVLGVWVTLFALPVGWFTALGGFAFFRLFDIWKPFPADWADRSLPGARGVMADDLVAGIYAQAVLRTLLRLGALL